jgi:hypothetical protein
MRRNALTDLIVIGPISTLAISGPLAIAQPAKQTPRYYVFSLGDPGGGNGAAAASINNLGWIAGDAVQPGNLTEHAELWVAPVDIFNSPMTSTMKVRSLASRVI